MRFVCDSCRAQYMISDDKVGPKGVKVRCKKCGHVILVRKTQDTAPAAAPDNRGDDEEAGTQVMDNPLASLGASLDQELTNPGGVPPAAAKAEPNPNSLLGASDDEIGAVFDQVLNSGVQKIPGAADDSEEKTEAGVGLGGDDDDRMSTRVLDAEVVKKLAAEAGLDASGAPKAASSNGEAKNGESKKDKDVEHDWYVAIDEKQVGPLKKEAVKEKWDAGEISPDSLCWRAGFSDWIPVSEAQELASVLAPRPNKPLIVGNGPTPQPNVVSVPVESAFSSGGVTRTVRSEVQVPMAAAGASGEEAPSGWKPSAASALASLVRDEIDALDKPSAPPPASPSSGEGAMAMGGGLLDLPSNDAPAAHGGVNGKSALFDEPAPAPAPRAPINGTGGYAQVSVGPTGGYAPINGQQAPAYPPAYAPYPPPAAQSGGNKTLMIISGVVVVLLLMMGGVIIYLVTRPPVVPVPVALPQNTVAMNQVQNPPDAVKETPKVEEKKAAPVEEKKAEEKPAEKPAEVAAKTEEKKAEEKPVEKVADKGVDMPKQKFAVKSTGSNTVKKPDEDVGTIMAKKEEPVKKIAEPKGTDDEFDSMFGGGGSKKSSDVASASAREEPKKKKDVYIPPAPGLADSSVQDKLGQSDIIAGVQANVPAIKKCVAEQKAKDPSVSGRIVMRWTIQTSGRVSNVSVKSEEFRSAYIGGCLGQVIKTMSFPKHKTQGPPVDFPFTF